MLCKASALEGLAIGAVDGDIGSVQTVYFDDEHWTVRYLDGVVSRAARDQGVRAHEHHGGQCLSLADHAPWLRLAAGSPAGTC
jgi:hypothetical protein